MISMLLTAMVRSFAHMPLKISDRNSSKNVKSVIIVFACIENG